VAISIHLGDRIETLQKIAQKDCSCPVNLLFCKRSDSHKPDDHYCKSCKAAKILIEIDDIVNVALLYG